MKDIVSIWQIPSEETDEVKEAANKIANNFSQYITELIGEIKL